MWTFKIPSIFIREKPFGNSLAVQWLGRHAFTAEGMGLIPDQETKISQGVQCSQKKKKSLIFWGPQKIMEAARISLSF